MADYPMMDEATWRTVQALKHPHAVYLRGEDALRVTAWNSVASAVVAIRGRRLRPDGRIDDFAETLIPTADRVATVGTYWIGEGWLLQAQALVTGAIVLEGETAVVLAIQRGHSGAALDVATLVQGFITQTVRRFWPGDVTTPSTVAGGAVRFMSGVDPAAGAECLITVPTGSVWSARAFWVELVTSAAVAARRVTLIIDDGVRTVASVTASADQTASLTRQYSAYPGGGAPRLDGTVFYLPTPPDLVMRAGYRIRTITANIQAADDYDVPRVLVVETLER